MVRAQSFTAGQYFAEEMSINIYGGFTYVPLSQILLYFQSNILKMYTYILCLILCVFININV